MPPATPDSTGTPRTAPMSSIGRAGVVIAAGTMVSRVTGLLRIIVLVVAIGSVGSRAADAFGVANQLPNNIYTIISTGILTAVIVPQIVKASQNDDGGQAYISKLFTLGTVVLLATTALAMIAAPWIVQLYAPGFTGAQQALAIALTYWCLPQIFFYGLYALVGEALNARRIFGPFAWAPIINNIVSIAGFVVLIALFGTELTQVSMWTPDMIALLGGTATLGIVAQCVVLLLFWKRTGLSLRPDFRWRGVGLAQTGRLAGWTFLMVLAGQFAGFVQSRVVSDASGDNVSIFALQNAWLLFMLPYSMIVLSIGTPYFTQLSEHAQAGKDEEVRNDIDRSIRTLGFFLAAATAAVAAAAVPASRVFTNSAADAQAMAMVLLCYLLALWPMSILFIVQRTFYAYGDTRTPFLFTVFQCALVIGTALGASALHAAGILPLQYLALAVALGQSVASIAQTIVASLLLRRKLGSIRSRDWMPALARFAIAALPAGLAGWGAYLWLSGPEGWMTSGILLGAVGSGVIALIVLAVYLGLMALMRVPELRTATTVLKRFLPGRG